MGILLASEIMERVSRIPARDFLRSRLFLPLGMTQTSLGLGGRPIPTTAQCQVAQKSDWDWNSPYWRDLGAPWGGAHSTAADVGRFLEFFIDPRPPVIKPATASEMIRNQNPGLNKPWGLGWMVEPGVFGKGCSASAFGHYGSTGTVAWLDPVSGLSCVLLTTRPAESSRHHLLGPVSDAVSALQ
jgi:CubicO group peptidase (beta-lactamase class C family)